MIALQASIGSLNDVVDAPRDAGRKPAQADPGRARLDGAGAARSSSSTAAIGLLLAVPSGPATVALAVVVLAIGYGYDLAFKGTAWSWLPFAVGIPLLPVFGWLGTAGACLPAFALLVPAAIVAGCRPGHRQRPGRRRA